MAFRAFPSIGFVSLGIAMGFALGGIAPRTELVAVEAELRDAKQRLSRFDRPNPLRDLLPALAERNLGIRPAPRADEGSKADDAAQLARDDDGSGSPAPRKPSDGGVVIIGARNQPAAGTTTVVYRDGPGSAAPGTPEKAKPEAARRDRPRGFQRLDLQRFDELAAAQAVRIAASRAALIDQAGLNEREVAEVDSTVKKMNDDLSGYGEEILQQASTDQPPAPSEALGLGHDVSGILLEGQKQIESIVGDRAESVDPDAIGVWNYVDIARLRPAAEKLLPGKAAAPAGSGSTSAATDSAGSGTGTGEKKP